jgi:hypothetical protein
LTPVPPTPPDDRAEKAVARAVPCPRCSKRLQVVPHDLSCVDVICEQCAFVAQVKRVALGEAGSHAAGDAGRTTAAVAAGAWRQQRDRIIAGIVHPVFVVGMEGKSARYVDYIPSHILMAVPEAFQPRRHDKSTGKRAAWQGYLLDLSVIPDVGILRVWAKS